MSKTSNSDLFIILTEIKQLLYRVIDAKFISSGSGLGTIIDVQKEELKKEAKKTVENLSCSAIYKVELLAYKLLTIKSFDWSKFHNFKYHQGLSKDKKVCQELHGGLFLVSSSDKETMEHFIFTEITAFFSSISGVIDNVALLIKQAFLLNIEGMVLLNEVYKRTDSGPLKDFLKIYTGDNYHFWGMRYVRTACEHQDLTKVFPYSKRAGLGTRDLGVPYINEDIRKPDAPEDNRIDIYCEFLHDKMCDFLKGLMVALSNTK